MTPVGVAVVLVAPALAALSGCVAPEPRRSPALRDELSPMREFMMQPLFSIEGSEHGSETVVFPTTASPISADGSTISGEGDSRQNSQ
jgi:hypothetical protein